MVYNVGQGTNLLSAGQPFEYEYIPCQSEADTPIVEEYRYPLERTGSAYVYDCPKGADYCGVKLRPNGIRHPSEMIILEEKGKGNFVSRMIEQYCPEDKKDSIIIILIVIICLLLVQMAMSKKK